MVGKANLRAQFNKIMLWSEPSHITLRQLNGAQSMKTGFKYKILKYIGLIFVSTILLQASASMSVPLRPGHYVFAPSTRSEVVLDIREYPDSIYELHVYQSKLDDSEHRFIFYFNADKGKAFQKFDSDQSLTSHEIGHFLTLPHDDEILFSFIQGGLFNSTEVNLSLMVNRKTGLPTHFSVVSKRSLFLWKNGFHSGPLKIVDANIDTGQTTCVRTSFFGE